MWRTSCGDRVLDGKERSLFVQAVVCLLDHLLEGITDNGLNPDGTCPTGVALFDRMEPAVRIVLLRDVVQALTDPGVPTPTLTAVNEAAVHAVFLFLRSAIEMEIDCEGLDDSSSLQDQNSLFWRTMAFTAYRESLGPDEVSSIRENVSPASTDMEEWDLQLECLADQILWDRDWELEAIADLAPRKARSLKQCLGINQDYFLGTAPEPDNPRVQEAVDFLRRLADEDRGAHA